MDMSLDTALLKRDVSFAMYGKVKDQAVQQSAQMLADFQQAQPGAAKHPTLGKVVDIRA
jgi:hypothetical protein